MELGQRIRSARLEKGLSQRQLCGSSITRNMLSQIENGSARPSMSTLQILAERLGKPVSYFLDEAASPNFSVMQQARAASPEEVPEILEGYREDDPVFDPERWLLEAICRLRLAEKALSKNQNAYALELLAQAEKAGKRTPYYTDALRRQVLLLSYQARPEKAAALSPELPDLTPELLLRGESALQNGQPEVCVSLLRAATRETPEVKMLLGQAYLQAGDPAAAAPLFLQIEDIFGPAVYPLLERCYRETEDFKMAYEYACKQRTAE